MIEGFQRVENCILLDKAAFDVLLAPSGPTLPENQAVLLL